MAIQFLSGVDRVISRLGPVSVLVNRIAERIVPQTVVTACHGNNILCWSECGSLCGSWIDDQTMQKFCYYPETIVYEKPWPDSGGCFWRCTEPNCSDGCWRTTQIINGYCPDNYYAT